MVTDDGRSPLHPGDIGAAVRDLRERLNAVGHPTHGDPPDEFASATEAAVRAFQEKRGLRVDGICGPHTWETLVEAGHRLGDRLLYLTSPMLRGDDVADLQRRLGSLGFDAGRVDGIFGSDTAQALTDFQRNAGITTDAIGGPDTVAALNRLGSRGTEGDPVARLREAESLREQAPTLAGLRVVVAEAGGFAAVADALGRGLISAGADVIVLHDPDDSRQAAQANRFESEAVVVLAGRAVGCGVAFYGRADYESIGGLRLAQLLSKHLGAALGAEPDAPRAMTLPILRETRAPAVVVEMGPPRDVAARGPEVAAAMKAALQAWVHRPT